MVLTDQLLLIQKAEGTFIIILDRLVRFLKFIMLFVKDWS
jgi:hypothetical protein